MVPIEMSSVLRCYKSYHPGQFTCWDGLVQVNL